MDSALKDPHNGSAEAGSPANGTTRPPSTPEGIALAYGSLLLMALLPIFFGALRSVRCTRGKNASDMPETITSRDAARFPIIASCTLLGLYLFFKVYFPNKSYAGSVLKSWKTQKSKKEKQLSSKTPPPEAVTASPGRRVLPPFLPVHGLAVAVTTCCVQFCSCFFHSTLITS
ncbi:histocompatibility minor 13 [Rhinolophus ferrumequinum]|uniref:Histocompatibility minor 13 n=1 Tax=Rhinolophus ferrumequinum TaxID=59479 RepID=A0A7J7S7P8_RHIFE|nr:histocompatibility minor 13 [Rhinolophus ferrumequinum]